MIDKESLILSLHDINAIKLGDTGGHAVGRMPMHIDLQMLTTRPATLRRVARIIQVMSAEMKFDRIAAIPMGGLAIGVALGLTIDVPVIYQRPMGHESNVGRYLAGDYKAGETVLVVDDLLTTGTSQLESLGLLEMLRLKVESVIVLLDRGMSGRAALEAKGYKVQAILTIPEILDTLLNLRRITPEQHRFITAWSEEGHGKRTESAPNA